MHLTFHQTVLVKWGGMSSRVKVAMDANICTNKWINTLCSSPVRCLPIRANPLIQFICFPTPICTISKYHSTVIRSGEKEKWGIPTKWTKQEKFGAKKLEVTILKLFRKEHGKELEGKNIFS